MIYRVFLLICTLTCGVFAQEKSEQDEPDPTGFDRAPEALEKLMEFTIDKEGRLRLRQDHWEEDKEPEGEVEPSARDLRIQNLREQAGLGGFGGFGGFGAGRSTAPFVTVFGASMGDIGSSPRQSGGGSRGSYGRYEGTVVNADYDQTGSNITFKMHEHSGALRYILVVDNDDLTRFLLVAPAGFVQLLRTGQGFHVSSGIDGNLDSASGPTFAHIVQAKPDYFKNRLSPALKGLAVLPVAAAEKFSAKEPASATSMELSDFCDKEFVNEEVRDALTPLLELHLADRRLRVSQFLGNEEVFDEELKRLKAIYKEALAESIKRLQKRGGTVGQVGKLNSYMGQYGSLPPPAFGGIVRSARGILFERLQTLAGGRSRGMGGGANGFHASFKSGKINGRINDAPKRQELEFSDGKSHLIVLDTESSTRILAISESSFIHLAQSDKPADCGLSIVGPGKTVHVQAQTYVGLIKKAEAVLHEAAIPIMAKYGISGMDPFSKGTVAKVLEQLKSELPIPMDVDSAVTATDAIVFPLLNNPEYLTTVADTLDEQRRKEVRKRVIGLRRLQRKR